mgnify:CR=1 FL=1
MGHNLAIPLPPVPDSAEDHARWLHSALRYRMLVGVWSDDLHDRLTKHIDPARLGAWGGKDAADLSSNVFKSIATQLAVLYDRKPKLAHDLPADSLIGEGGAIDRSGLWSMMPRFSQNVIGIREMGMRVSFTEKHGLRYRAVSPSLLVCRADPERPDLPVTWQEARLRKKPDGTGWWWTWDVLSIEDEDAPVYRIVEVTSTGPGADLTEMYTGTADLSGDAYPFRRRDGRPILPAVLYHAENTGQLWDPYNWREVVDGSLQVAVLFSLWSHAVRQASWPQRYGVNVRVPGLDTVDIEGAGRRQRIPTDPTSLLLFESDGDFQPMLGQFQPGASVDVLLSSILSYEQRIAVWAGLNPSDIERSHAARSGYAVAITNSGKRAAQRKYSVTQGDGDTRLAMLSAILMNRAMGTSFPEGGYRIRYESVPKSAEERKSEREHVLALVEAGLMDLRSAFMEINPGTSPEDADKALREIQGVDDEATNGAPLPSLPTADNLQVTALNGAQVVSAQQIVQAVAARTLPRATGIEMLANFFSLPTSIAESIMGDVGSGFFVSPPE